MAASVVPAPDSKMLTHSHGFQNHGETAPACRA